VPPPSKETYVNGLPDGHAQPTAHAQPGSLAHSEAFKLFLAKILQLPIQAAKVGSLDGSLEAVAALRFRRKRANSLVKLATKLAVDACVARLGCNDKSSNPRRSCVRIRGK